MKKISVLILTLISSVALYSQNICDNNGNIAIYSNYDGGPLTINVDQNIPNLKIGIVTYEYAVINITGPFAGNVTQVWYAGYDAGNNHCNMSPPYTTSITGVPNPVDTITLYPPSTYSNSNGYQYIICNYSCDNQTNQGGCNTPDQIVHFFVTKMGGAMRYHFTQYGCFSGTYNVSAGGNCCISPFPTGELEYVQSDFMVIPNPSSGMFHLTFSDAGSHTLQVLDPTGREIKKVFAEGPGINFDLSEYQKGIYLVKVTDQNGNISVRRIQLLTSY